MMKMWIEGELLEVHWERYSDPWTCRDISDLVDEKGREVKEWEPKDILFENPEGKE